MQRRRFLQVAAAVLGLAVTPGTGVAAPEATAPVAITVKSSGTEAFIPKLWASESLRILEENIAISKLVHRDFKDQLHEVVS